jgi:hypothetical protein
MIKEARGLLVPGFWKSMSFFCANFQEIIIGVPQYLKKMSASYLKMKYFKAKKQYWIGQPVLQLCLMISSEGQFVRYAERYFIASIMQTKLL